MADAFVDVFCEDAGHEAFLRALLTRLSLEEGVGLQQNFISGRGGAGKAITELKGHQARASRRGARSDLLVVLIDSNCVGRARKRKEIDQVVREEAYLTTAVGCPDPHVERWMFADPLAYRDLIGGNPPADPGKCDRDVYKKLLADSFEEHGFYTTTGPMEAATDLVPMMRLHNKLPSASQSLKSFVGDLQAALKRLRTLS